jgi:multidrug efflux pump subunit AcrA (membrane-fusion protein)
VEVISRISLWGKKRAVILSLGALIIAGCSMQPAAMENVEKTTPVMVSKVKKDTLKADSEFIGTLTAAQQITIVPKLAGELKTLAVQKGDSVKKGQLLAQIDDRDLALALEMEKAALLQVQGQLETALIGQRQTSNELELAKAALRQAELSYHQQDGNADPSSPTASGAGSQTEPVQRENAPAETAGSREYPDLTSINLENLRLAWEEAQKNLERMTALYEAGAVSQAEYENAVNNEKRARLAYQQGQLNAAGSASSLEQAKIRLKQAEENMEQAKVSVAQAQNSVSQARLRVRQAADRVQDAKIVAPIDGKVFEVFAEPGETVSPQSPLITLLSADSLKLELSVSAEQLALFSAGKEYPVTVPALGETVTGTVQYIAPAADASGLYKIEAVISSHNTAVKPGMAAKLVVQETLAQDALLVPTQAIVEQAGESYVFVVENGIAVKKIVEIIKSQTEWTAVKGDLKENDTIVIKGQITLSDGNKVSIVKEGNKQ